MKDQIIRDIRNLFRLEKIKQLNAEYLEILKMF